MEKSSILTQMTLEERVGQLFHLGIEGAEITSTTQSLIKQYAIGGVLLFRRNIQSLYQVSNLISELQEQATERGLPLLISIDEEGGIVTRLKGGIHFPGLMSLGATKDTRLAQLAGEIVAKELKSLGINMNLAPVLDVNNNPKNPIIGSRSFGEDPLLVAQLGSAYIKGMQKEGIIACGKHFPGHGDTGVDSHLDLPVIQRSISDLQNIELYPYREAIRNHLDSIMTAHIYYPALEPKRGCPATLSSSILQGLLRKQLGFNGLIITDCMEMDAITAKFTAGEGAIQALEAGADMVLISHTFERQREAIESVLQAIKTGRLEEERINQSTQRVLALKERRVGLTYQKANRDLFDRKRGEEVARKIAAESVTLVRDTHGLLPIHKKKPTLLLEYPFEARAEVEEGANNKSHLGAILKERGVIITTHVLQKGDKEMPPLQTFQQILFLTNYAKRGREEVDCFHRILRQSSVKPIVISIYNPYDLIAYENISTCLTTYDPSPYNIEALAKALLGEERPRGQLPITLNG